MKRETGDPSTSSGQALRVLGIDPGLSVSGYGIVAYSDGDLRALDYGAWRLPHRLSLPERLHRLHEAIAQTIAAWRPQEVAVEDFFVGHARAAVTIGEVRAMALLASAQAGLPVHLYKPLEVKQFVTSYGHGSKQQVQEMVRVLLGLERAPEPEDAADALAMAVCHCLKRNVAAIVSHVAARLGLDSGSTLDPRPRTPRGGAGRGP